MFKVFANRMSVSNLVDTPYNASYVKRDLVHALAEDIMTANIQREEYADYTVYGMQVIVATKEDFFKAVAAYSMKTSSGYPMTLESLSDERRT